MKKAGPGETTISVVKKRANCPVCLNECGRHSLGRRRIRGLHGVTVVVYSKHYCPICQRYFSLDVPELAGRYDRYGRDFKVEAVRLVRVGHTLEWVASNLRVPVTTIFDWVMDATLRAG